MPGAAGFPTSPDARPALRPLRTFLPLLAAVAAAACAPAKPDARADAKGPPAASAVRGVDPAEMDRSAIPGDDFYAFANGNYLRTTEIPADRSSVGAFLKIGLEVEKRNRAIAEEAARSTAPAGSELRKIGDVYTSFMDEAGIEKRGLAPLQPALARIAAISDARSLAAYLGGRIRADVDPMNATNFFTPNVLGVFVEQALADPTRSVPYLMQGGLGLPDRSYFLDPSPKLAEIRTAYEKHLARSMELAGIADPAARASRVMAFETKLAAAHATREASEDMLHANNPWTRAELESKAPGMDWAAFLGAAGLDGQPMFIVWHPSAVTGLAALVKSEPIATWKEYLVVREVERASPFLPRALAEEFFAYYGTTLDGTPKQRDRWKRALEMVDRLLGDAMGKVYVARHFPAESKAEIQGMVRNIQTAFARRIDALDWMSPATKAKAKEKLAALRVGIGYPDRWKTYEGLEIRPDDPIGNVERSEVFEYRRALAKLGHPADRDEWCMVPQEVNAVNLPVRNALNFPAAILEPPFYDRNATAAVKYAAIGATIGHEVSHSFDDQGAQFDARGLLTNWWTAEDLAHFQAAGAKLAQQYDGYRPFPDVAVNGKQTLSENIADLAGLAAAHDAWRASLGGTAAPVVDGLSGEQQFFVSYGQSWQSKEREAVLRRQILTNGHAPARYRALTVRNLDPWYAAFDVKPGQALYLAPDARVRVW